MNFLLGKWLRRKSSAAILWLGVLLNVLLLSTFKYLPAIAVHFPVSWLQGFAHLLLPLGISFWTFQALSYLFDVYRGEELDPSLAEFALYMVFFPVTIEGPICRLPDMLPQFRSEETTSWSNMERGVRRILMGAFMTQLASLLGAGLVTGGGVNGGFDKLTHWSGTDVWCLIIGYGLQIFFDFAGYSHMAIGAALAMGFVVPENFERPFASTSPAIFWTRWHMSLSFWIRDYIFLPLAMLRREVWWRNLALVIAMTMFGLWHGATALFIIWGCYQGILLVLHRQIQQAQRKFDWEPPARLWTVLSWIATMALMNLGWIFFGANSLAQARAMLTALFSPSSYASHYLNGSLYLLVACIAVGYAITLLVIDALDRSTQAAVESGPQSGFSAALARWRWYWLTPLYGLGLLFLWIMSQTQGEEVGRFMYRNF